jgi:hypothetical protein
MVIVVGPLYHEAFSYHRLTVAVAPLALPAPWMVASVAVTPLAPPV